jgi:hypothetical protein
LDRIAASEAAAYPTGMGSAAMIAQVPAMAAAMRLERLQALHQRENALTDLALMAARVTPSGLAVFPEPEPTP